MSHTMILDAVGRAILDGGDQLSQYVTQRGFSHDGMMRQVIMPLIAPGDVVVDGGAALGDHTVPYIERVGANGMVYAFEPHPEYFKCLRHNAPGAITIPCALWEGHCEFRINESTGNVGGSFVSLRHEPLWESFPATGIALDAFGLRRVDFIKLDLEGAEYFALMGMSKTIARCRPKMVLEMRVELMNRYAIKPASILTWFRNRGYHTTSVCGNPDPEAGECDLLAMPL